MTAKTTDWEAIERQYRAGVVSVREIGREHGVSDTAIRKRATAENWERDLTGKVKERTRVKLVRSSSSHDGSHEQRAQTDAEIIEEASETQVTVVKTHRRDIAIGRRIVSTLFGELMEATEQRHEIAEAVEEATAKDKDGKRRAMMHRAVALPSRAATAQSLANAMKTLVTLERQAFNIETDASDEEVPVSVRVQIEDASIPEPKGEDAEP